LPKDDENEMDIDIDFDVEAQIDSIYMRELREVQELIDKLNPENPIDANEYIQCDGLETTTEMITDEEVLKVVLPNDQGNEEEEELDPFPPITHNEAIESYDKVILYLEQQENDFDTKEEELKFIKKLQKEALKRRFISAKQTNLNNFIIN